MHPEKHLPELMAEKNSLDPSFVHAVRLLAEGKSQQEVCPFPPSHLHLLEMRETTILAHCCHYLFTYLLMGGLFPLVLVGASAQLFCHHGEQLPLQKFHPQSSQATFPVAQAEAAAAFAAILLRTSIGLQMDQHAGRTGKGATVAVSDLWFLPQLLL